MPGNQVPRIIEVWYYFRMNHFFIKKTRIRNLLVLDFKLGLLLKKCIYGRLPVASRILPTLLMVLHYGIEGVSSFEQIILLFYYNRYI